MAIYENQYRKRSSGKYDKGKTGKSFPLALIVSLAVIVVLGLVVYNYRDPILRKIAEISRKLDPPREAKRNHGTYERGEREVPKQAPVEQAPTPQKDKPTENPVVTPGKKPATLTPPQTPTTPAEPVAHPKPTEPAVVDISKHKIERFVDQQSGKYGLKDLTTNKIIVEAKYDEIQKFRYNQKITTHAIVRNGDLWGIVSTSGKLLVAIEYTKIYDWSDRYPDYYELYKRDYSDPAVKRNVHHLYGLVRMPDGKITVPVEYANLEYAERYMVKTPALIIAQKPNELRGIITINNDVKVPFEYYDIGGVRDDNHLKLCKRTSGSPRVYTYGLLRTSDCKVIIPVEYDELEVVGPSSFLRVKKDGLYGCINDKNQIIVPFQKTNGVGMTQGGSDSKNNTVWFTLPNGDMACYNIKGERVPCD